MNIDALRILAGRCTPGPWAVDYHHDTSGLEPGAIIHGGGDTLTVWAGGDGTAADAELAAQARTAIPWLIDLVEQLQTRHGH